MTRSFFRLLLFLRRVLTFFEGHQSRKNPRAQKSASTRLQHLVACEGTSSSKRGTRELQWHYQTTLGLKRLIGM